MKEFTIPKIDNMCDEAESIIDYVKSLKAFVAMDFIPEHSVLNKLKEHAKQSLEETIEFVSKNDPDLGLLLQLMD